jgi:phosphopentomutase
VIQAVEAGGRPGARKRVLCLVLDSVGCGNAPDAAAFGDEGADTLGHLFARVSGLRLPALESLGLAEVLGLPRRGRLRTGATWARLTARAPGKDTTSGHWELMGCEVPAFETFVEFPAGLVDELERRGGVGFLGNRPASGTEILKELGAEHLRTGRPILYTSADSVMQIAAHEERFGLERLLALCGAARELLDERGIRIGRVIARPFLGETAEDFHRTSNRHDFSMSPPESVLDRLQQGGVATVGIGKIADIFAGAGIGRSLPTVSNADGMAKITEVWKNPPDGRQFVFANLVEFDSLYGHRRDPAGYAGCLREFDAALERFLPEIQQDDALLITADHGNDPYFGGTDHTREQAPLLGLNLPAPLQDGDFSRVANVIMSCLC